FSLRPGGATVPLSLGARGERLTLRRRKLDLPEPDRARGDLDRLVVPDELERQLERERPRWDETHELLRRGAAHVRELLRLRGVPVQIVFARVLSDDHPLVELVARSDEERAALLQVEDRVPGGLSSPVGDEAPRRPCAQVAVPRFPGLEDVVEDAGAARLG